MSGTRKNISFRHPDPIINRGFNELLDIINDSRATYNPTQFIVNTNKVVEVNKMEVASTNGMKVTTRVSPGERLVIDTAQDLRTNASPTFKDLTLQGDGTNAYIYTPTGSGTNLNLQPDGDIVLYPQDADVYPFMNYETNLGLIDKKFLTLHAAELWVETLVAEDTAATIGGRILVGTTTSLISDLDSLDTTIDVKHNQMVSGDRVYMEANGKVEFMAITSSASSITDGYRYSVTRDLDGTGANDWYAGDAVFNTGQVGDGFIDLYSIQGVKAGSTQGPTIVGNVRNSSTYNDWTEHWAIGQLNGLYGLSSRYGVGLGKYNASTGTYMLIDDTDGITMHYGGTTTAQWKLDGSLTIGSESTEHLDINSSSILFKDSTTTYGSLITNEWTLGQTTGQNIVLNPSGLTFKNSSTALGSLTGTTWTLGNTSTENVQITSSALQFRFGSTVYGQLDGTELTLGLNTDNYIKVDTSGLTFYDGGLEKGSLTSTAWILGSTSTENVYITPTAIQLRDGSTVHTDLSSGTLTLGINGNGYYRMEVLSSGLYLKYKTAGGIDQNKIWLSSVGSAFFDGTIYASGGYFSNKVTVGTSGNTVDIDGANKWLTSSNYVSGTTGFRLLSDGSAEFNNVTVRGSINATTGTVGGWTISSTTLANSTNIVLDSSNKKISIKSATYGTDGVQIEYNSGNPRMYIGDGANQYFNFDGSNISFKGNNAELTTGGTFTASNAVITGSITSTSGAIGGWTIGSTSISSNNLYLNSAGNIRAGQTAYNTGNGFWLGNDGGTYKFSIGNSSTGKTLTYDGTNLRIDDAIIPSIGQGSEIAIQGWSQTMVYTPTSHFTCSWTSGEIALQDGTTYSINSGNATASTVPIYIFFDKNVSTTTLDYTSSQTGAIGGGRILVAVLEPILSSVTDYTTKNALVTVFGKQAKSLIVANDIVSNTLTSNVINTTELYSNTVNVTGWFNANGMKFGENVDGGTSDGIYINSSNYWYSTGLFNIGGTNGILYNGSTITLGSNTTINGSALAGSITSTGTITGGTIQTASSGERITINQAGYSNQLRFYDSTGTLAGGISASTSGGFPILNFTAYDIRFSGAYLSNTGDISSSQYMDAVSGYKINGSTVINSDRDGSFVDLTATGTVTINGYLPMYVDTDTRYTMFTNASPQFLKTASGKGLLAYTDNDGQIGGASFRFANIYGVNINATAYKDQNGVQVLGVQQAAISNVDTGGIPATNAAAINLILSRLRAHGIIAT